MKNYVIEVNHVSKSFKVGKQILPVIKDISLNIERGEFVSIMGPSGSGKSTLLYMMGGLDNVTSGTILVGGKEILKMNDAKQSKARRSNIGFVFQFYNLIPNLSVEENIFLPAKLDGRKIKDVQERYEKLLEVVRLKDRRKHLPRELSGGEQQRAAIARALINDPEIIFADEPTGNLDSKTGIQVLELLREINQKEKTTIIMVTHDQNSTKYGTRTIHIKDGKIYKDGPISGETGAEENSSKENEK